MLYSNDDPPKTVEEPSYSVLRDWFEAWPEARPELLDFWARGGYVQRLMWRQQRNAAAVSVGVRHLDEIGTVIRRLALLDLEADIIWSGDVGRKSLVIAPQDIDYEGVGGWGYTTCSGDELDDKRKGREWCPSLAWASLLPDTITDWLANEAADYFYDGKMLVCPADAVAIERRASTGPIEHPPFTHTTQIRSLRKHVDLLFTVDLPVLDKMSLHDLYKFCKDYGDELASYRRAVARLISPEPSEPPLSHDKILSEIDDAVSELRSSDRGKGMRNALTAAGGALVSAQLAVAVNTGGDYANTVFTAAGAALAAANWWNDRLSAERERRRNPYWILWKLQGKQDRPVEFRSPRLQSGVHIPRTGNAKPDSPSHWLAPPSGGWVIPSAIIPKA